MKIWLDDQYDDVICIDRRTPTGFVGSSSVLQVCRWIKEGKVQFISFDFDLGSRSPFSGGTVAKFIEKLAFQKKISKIEWGVHSRNPLGAKAIWATMFSAERFWAEQ